MKSLVIRIGLIIFSLFISITCIWNMQQSFDPLARYPYVTSENRDVLLTFLNNEDIDYIITQQMKPDVFLEFIQIPGFDIHNALYYRMAMDTQKENPDYIVNFVNRFRSHFSLSILQNLLTYYSYMDLTSFYENELVLQNNLNLIDHPDDMFALVNENNSIYKFAPKNLVNYDSIVIRKEVVENLQAMQEAYAAMMQEPLVLQSGYMSYDAIYAVYNKNLNQNENQISNWMYRPGQDERQLGYTIVVDGYETWLKACLEQDSDKIDYAKIIDKLDDNLTKRMEWLEENAYRYGFVIRFPSGKEGKTGHWFQPFELRYVTSEYAKEMYESKQCFEETNFDEEAL